MKTRHFIPRVLSVLQYHSRARTFSFHKKWHMFFISASLATCPPIAASTYQIAALHSPTIAQMPVIHGDKVLIQDFVQGSFRFRFVAVPSGAVSEFRNNMTSYLYPSTFGGQHVAWLEYALGGGGPSGPTASYAAKAQSATSSTTQTVSTGSAYKEHITTDGARVVWSDYRHFTASDTTVELYGWSGSESRITNQKGYKSAPFIRGTKLVWVDYRNKSTSNPKNSDIYFYDFSTQNSRAITTNTGYQDQPCVDGNYVVWQDYRNTGSNPKNADIYLYDLSSTTEKAICTAPGYQSDPKVYGNIIVWHDYRNTQTDTTNADIYLYDLASNTEHPVTTKAGYQAQPYLYGNSIVWHDYTDTTIYLATLTLNGTGAVEGISVRPIAGPHVQKSVLTNGNGFSVNYSISGRREKESAFLPRFGFRAHISSLK